MKKSMIVLILGLLLMSIFLTGCQQDNEVIKIGVLLPISGTASIIGENILSGMNKAQDEINQNGELVELIYEDHKNDPKEAITSFQKLINVDDVDMIITTMSGTSAAIAPLAKENNIPLLSTVVYLNVPEIYNNSVQIYVQPEDEAKALIDSVDKLNVSNLGILCLQNDYGILIKEEIENSLGSKINITTECYQYSDLTFQTQILKLKESNVDTIYMITFPHTVATMIKEARTLGFNGTIITNAPLYLNGMIGSNNVFDNTYTSVPTSYLNRNDYPSGNKYLPYDLLKIISDKINKGNFNNIIDKISNMGQINTSTHGKILMNSKTKIGNIPMSIVRIKEGKIIKP
jgi:ABC-type branched-subunit amino acid transport system substrate-binding protein